MSTSWDEVVVACRARVDATEALLELTPQELTTALLTDPTSLPGAFIPLTVAGPPPAHVRRALAEIQARSERVGVALADRIEALAQELQGLRRVPEPTATSPEPRLFDRTG